jgi:hypothetical protein
MRGGPTPLDPFAALAALLRAAQDLAAALARDRSLERLLAAVARLPIADRSGVIDKLERGVAARQRSLETGDGVVGPPNPLASLYIGVYENRETRAATRDSALRATMQSLASMLAYPGSAREQIETGLFAQLAALDPDDRRLAAAHYQDLLALADAVDDEVAPAGVTEA